MHLDVIIVAAVAENGVIGRGNALPWRLKSDMAHFRTLTMGKPVVLGRKTFASIGKPLPGRTTIVIAGGADVYAQALPRATRIVISEVHKRVDGDTRFPTIDSQIWRETARSEQKPGPQDEAAFAFVTYERAVNVPPNAA